MTKAEKKKRTSKAEWLEAAMGVLDYEGIDAVKIERIAKELKTSRSGFYWHFQNRADLLRDMMKYWRTEYNDVVLKNTFLKQKMAPEKRLYLIMKMIEDHDLDRFEVHMRSWADHDPEAAEVVTDVYRQRFDFISSIFEEMGFSGSDMVMRTRLWLCYATHGKSMFPGGPCDDENKDMIQIRHAILTSKDQEGKTPEFLTGDEKPER